MIEKKAIERNELLEKQRNKVEDESGEERVREKEGQTDK